MLVEIDDVVLLGAELAGHILRGHHPDGALLALNLRIRFHLNYFHNYSQVRWRSLQARCSYSQVSENVRKRYAGPNQILNLSSSGDVS